MTALSSGIGSWSCAWKRTAASSSASFSVGGTCRTRTTIFWFATPTRTRLPRPLLSRQSPRSAAVRPAESTTSPSRRTPASSGAVAARDTEMLPLTRTSAAAIPLGSMSRPVRILGVFAMWRVAAGRSLEAGDPSGYRRSPARLETGCGARDERPWVGAEPLEPVEVAVDDRVADEVRDRAAEGEERPERDRGPAPLGHAPARDDARADDDAGDERDEDRRRDGAAEVEPQHRDELDVAHAHAPRADHRGEKEEAAGPGRRGEGLREEAGIEREDRDDGRERRRTGDEVRDDPVL